ncbi:MAG: ribbon-helix-helix protein, CopG family [Deltaproteobacteria bacterium]|nr:ribbon-helix-helix protein, CopG family [Deltaproteobacteria bacterium]
MRTTIQVDDQVLRDIKKLAASSGKTLGSVIEEALREKLARRQELSEDAPVSLPVFKGAGLQPGVDLDDSRALLDRMEER